MFTFVLLPSESGSALGMCIRIQVPYSLVAYKAHDNFFINVYYYSAAGKESAPEFLKPGA